MRRRTTGKGTAAWALLLLCAAAVPARAGDPPAAGDPPKPAPPPKPVPVDAGLDPESTIKREALSDPRNLKRDAFPAIRQPVYVPLLKAARMDPEEWVLGVTIGERTLLFPTNVLNQHEIVVDASGDVPFLVTWCPLCRTGSAFLRTVDGAVLDFGHSGNLYRGAFLLYDRSTGSLWHNATGRALTGRMRGRSLDRLPTRFLTWEAWRRSFPGAEILLKDTQDPDHVKDAYRDRNLGLKLAWGLGVRAGAEARLYEFTELERTSLVQERVADVPVVVVFHPPTGSALAFDRTLDGEVLDLRRAPDSDDGMPRLEETGQRRSTFDGITGVCLDGPRKGKRLALLPSSHWEVFAWMAHHPRGTTYRASVPPPVDLPDVGGPGGDPPPGGGDGGADPDPGDDPLEGDGGEGEGDGE